MQELGVGLLETEEAALTRGDASARDGGINVMAFVNIPF